MKINVPNRLANMKSLSLGAILAVHFALIMTLTINMGNGPDTSYTPLM